MLYREILKFKTKKGIDIIDLTSQLKEIIKKSRLQEGLCNMHFTGTTAGLMINENDRMLLEDVKKFIKGLIDETKLYHHTDNAFSHVRALLFDRELTIPLSNNELILGTWQSILFLEFDNKERNREIVVTISGD